jgi:GNAT superfamily N-acetyltransferase
MYNAGVPPARRAAAGRLWSWWRGDALPELPWPDGLVCAPWRPGDDFDALPGLPASELPVRLAEGDQLYLAKLDGRAVAFGWSASRRATFGPPRRRFDLPDGERYLWGFATLPPWRGRRVYPRLLQHILVAETDATRFWIFHHPANEASARGIARAGFRLIGTSRFLADGGVGLDPAEGDPVRAQPAAELLGIPRL